MALNGDTAPGMWKMVAVMFAFVLVVAGFVAFVEWMQASALSAVNARLTDDNKRLQQGWFTTNLTLTSQGAAILRQDSDFLLFLYTKMADLSKNKSLIETSRVFSLLETEASVLSLQLQNATLCQNATNAGAFNATKPIADNYTLTCESFASSVPAVSKYEEGQIDINTLQAAIYGLFERLVELDNAIAKDP